MNPLRVKLTTDEFHALGGWVNHRDSTYHFSGGLIAKLQDLQEEQLEAEAHRRAELFLRKEREDNWTLRERFAESEGCQHHRG